MAETPPEGPALRRGARTTSEPCSCGHSHHAYLHAGGNLGRCLIRGCECPAFRPVLQPVLPPKPEPDPVDDPWSLL